MEKYNEIISKPLIDFEEIKYVLANNNIKLVKSNNIKNRYFLNKMISFKTANFDTIIENSYILSTQNTGKYLCYKSSDNGFKILSKIAINDEQDCVDFLNHIGFNETFMIEKNIYTYSDGENELSIIDLLGNDLYLNVKKENANEEELKAILESFKIPFKEDQCNESIEKKMIVKLRRYLK